MGSKISKQPDASMRLQDDVLTDKIRNNLKELIELAFAYIGFVKIHEIPKMYKKLHDTKYDYKSLGFKDLKSSIEELTQDYVILKKFNGTVYLTPKDRKLLRSREEFDSHLKMKRTAVLDMDPTLSPEDTDVTLLLSEEDEL